MYTFEIAALSDVGLGVVSEALQVQTAIGGKLLSHLQQFKTCKEPLILLE